MKQHLHALLAFNPSRYYLERFLERAASQMDPGQRVLDAGAGELPYQKLFTHTRYESTDQGLAYQPSGLDYLADLSALPVQTGAYDHIICTQVLEHVPEPGRMLGEFCRLLKPGGKLWLSAPLFYPEHQIPYDYYRFTRFGLRYLHEQAGFVVEEIEPLEGLMGVLAYQCQKGAQWLPVGASAYPTGCSQLLVPPLMLFIRLGFGALSVLFAHLDRWIRIDRAGYCKNYTVIAYNPESPR